MNNAPVFGYEKDAGSRTTIRLIYPEGAPSQSQEYENTEVVALVAFKSLDLAWLTSVVTKEPLVSNAESFWEGYSYSRVFCGTKKTNEKMLWSVFVEQRDCTILMLWSYFGNALD